MRLVAFSAALDSAVLTIQYRVPVMAPPVRALETKVPVRQSAPVARASVMTTVVLAPDLVPRPWLSEGVPVQEPFHVPLIVGLMAPAPFCRYKRVTALAR
jgi:hypothetical protein